MLFLFLFKNLLILEKLRNNKNNNYYNEINKSNEYFFNIYFIEKFSMYSYLYMCNVHDE